MRADVLQRGVSDHIRGRGLGRPSGHFGWSLTPRDSVGDHSGGGVTRRAARSAARRRAATCPTTCTCPDVLAGCESHALTIERPRHRAIEGEHLARRYVPPCVPPPGALIEQLGLNMATPWERKP